MNAAAKRIARLESKMGSATKRQVVLRQIIEPGASHDIGAGLIAAHVAAYPADAMAEFLVIQRVVI